MAFPIPLMCLSSYLITLAHVNYVFVDRHAVFYIYSPHVRIHTHSHNNGFHLWKDSVWELD